MAFLSTEEKTNFRNKANEFVQKLLATDKKPDEKDLEEISSLLGFRVRMFDLEGMIKKVKKNGNL